MADTLTATYSFIKPGINDPAGTGTWGTKINANMDSIDSHISTLAGLISSGGSGGGGGTVGPQGPAGPAGPAGAQGPQGSPGLDGAPGPQGPPGAPAGSGPIPGGVFITGGVNTNRFVQGQTSGSPRWQVNLGNTNAESGTLVGSDFSIVSFNNSGQPNSTSMSIQRSTGAVSFNGPVASYANAINPNPVFRLEGSDTTVKGSLLYQISTTTLNNTISLNNAVGGGFCGVQGDGSFVISSGTAYKTGGGSWTASSDERIKDVVGEYDLGLEAVTQLRPVVYRYKGNDGDVHREAAESGQEFVGLIAQEVEDIMPDMVSMKEGEIDGERVDDLRVLDTSSLIFALVNAVKQLKRELNELRGHVDRL